MSLPAAEPLVVDFDDAYDGHDALARLQQLKALNPLFCVTLFAIPGRCTDDWCESLPRWIELAVHGFMHPDPHECSDWTKEQLLHLLDEPIVKRRFVSGFKAPGWQISGGCYEALLQRDFWVADQRYNDDRRPSGLRVHCERDGNHWHGHIDNVCGNGIEETWGELSALVRDTAEFRFVSQATRLGADADDSRA